MTQAVYDELAGMSAAERHPALAQLALTMAALLDNANAVQFHARGAKELRETMAELHKLPDQQRGKLATVRALRRPGGVDAS